MNTRTLRPALLCGLAALLVMTAAGPGVIGAQVNAATGPGITGRAFHIVTEEPVMGAVVSVQGLETVTDDRGVYTLALPAGSYTVEAHASGYIGMSHLLRPVTEGLTTVDFALVPEDADEAMNAAIVEALDLHAQEAPDEHELWLDQGYSLSGVTTLPDTIRVAVRQDPAVRDSPIIEVVTLPFEEYIKGILPYEMSPSWPHEALKAQAVAARSYAAANMNKHAAEGADVCSSVHCQVWRPTLYDTTNAAADATRGVAATYGGTIIAAYYFNHCDGRTRSTEEEPAPSWSYVPYCRSVPCSCGFTTLSGHGAGMCQWGARAMAIAGSTFDQIVHHYYTGVALTSAPPTTTLNDGRVEPASGDRGTVFTFRVRYTSAGGEMPPVANVILDGYTYSLSLDGGSAATGWTYAYHTALAEGTHNYRFEFDDGQGRLSRWPEAGLAVGPAVSAAGAIPAAVLRGSVSASVAAEWTPGLHAGTAVVTMDKDVLTLATGQTQGTFTSPVVTPGATFIAYGPVWYADVPAETSLVFETRSSLDGASWKPWRTEEGVVYRDQNARLQSAELVSGEARYLQYRITMTGTAAARPTVRNVRITCLDTRAGPQASDLEMPAPAYVPAPPVVTRAQWGANESWMTWPPEYHTVMAAVLHHTVTSDGGVDPAAIVRAIYAYHALPEPDGRGWGDIGYNYLVDHDGRIYQGRAGGGGVVGAHASQYNWGSVGLGMIGDFDTEPVTVPAAQYNAVIAFLAWQFDRWGIDPLGSTYLVDRTIPTIVGHRDLSATACPGQYFYPLMGQVRTDTAARMFGSPPTISITSPAPGTVRGLVTPVFTVSPDIAGMYYYVDGNLRAWQPAPFAWVWNTANEPDGPHTLTIAVQNAAGWADDNVTVTVDNTPPGGSVLAPAWTAATQIAVSVTGTDATGIGFSPGWTWEGENLYHASGVPVADAAASAGAAWLGRGGNDRPGAWYGPYTCIIPPAAGAYDVLFRLKTDSTGDGPGLATLDVADAAGGVTYGQLPVGPRDFTGTAYQDFRVPLTYPSPAYGCSVGSGLEFRTWYSGAGNLWLDRVRVYTAPVAFAGTHTVLTPNEGRLNLSVRLLDAVGNASEHTVTVIVDRTGPQWVKPFGSAYYALDTGSGMDVAQAAWQESFDGGSTWSDWHPLALTATGGTTGGVRFYTTAATGNRVRYRAVDRAGNTSVSPALVAGLGLPPFDHTLRFPMIGR